MKVVQAPAGGFFIASQDNLVVFDRDKNLAIRRLACLIWPMPPANYFTEDVSAARSRPKAVQQKG